MFLKCLCMGVINLCMEDGIIDYVSVFSMLPRLKTGFVLLCLYSLA